jgi:putative acetyltransferase
MALTIKPLTDDQVEAAKAVIAEGCFEFFGQAPLAFEDMDDISANYAGPSGTFLVLIDDGQVVGTGAIRRLDDQTCELKRMWFLPPYRGKGYGTKMSELLLGFARSAGYKRVRLDTAPELESATKLYQRLGFGPRERYNDGPCTMFMEKQL